MAFAAEDIVGTRFRLNRLVGRGGMGEVWAASDLQTGRWVALKILHASPGRGDIRKRFLAEARVASAIDHPGVVPILEVVTLDDETPALVMPLLIGESLADLLSREAPIEIGVAAAIVAPLIDAVGAAHARGFVHRDLKPDNIFLTFVDERIEPRVLDFGIAKRLVDEGETRSIVTATGATLGTACYMAPEQGFGEKDVDARADIWSLGVILYEALSAVRPIEADGLGQYLKRLMSDAITPLRALGVDVPSEVEELVMSMLNRDRDARPSLTDVASVLTPFVDAEALRSRSKISLPELTVDMARHPAIAIESAHSITRIATRSGSSALRWGLVAGCTAIAGVAASFALTSQAHDDRTTSLVASAGPASNTSTPIVSSSVDTTPVRSAQIDDSTGAPPRASTDSAQHPSAPPGVAAVVGANNASSASSMKSPSVGGRAPATKPTVAPPRAASTGVVETPPFLARHVRLARRFYDASSRSTSERVL